MISYSEHEKLTNDKQYRHPCDRSRSHRLSLNQIQALEEADNLLLLLELNQY